MAWQYRGFRAPAILKANDYDIHQLAGLPPQLESRIESGEVQEVIIALPSDVEGDATSYYLNKLLAPRGLRISRIAHGLPVGGGLEFADEMTLSRALEGRRPLT